MKNHQVMKKKWTDYPIIAIDTETSGQYPIQDDLCEIAAVRSINGQVVDKYQTLVKPNCQMSDFIIGIHGITNEMVKKSPKVNEVIGDFLNFIKDGVIVAHHSPFDLGFLVYELEKQKLFFPSQPVLCTSLISQKSIQGSEDHKLQTLVQYLGLDGGTAHRALDDARASLQVLFECFRRKEVKTFAEAFKLQGEPIWWQDFSLKSKRLQSQLWDKVITAIENKKNLEIIYTGGSLKGQKREVSPLSVVCNPKGDFMAGIDKKEPDHIKRFYFKRLTEAEILF